MKKKIAQVITRLDWAGSPDIVRIICAAADPFYEITIITGPSNNLTPATEKFLKEYKNNIIFLPWLRRQINPFYDFMALCNLYSIFRKNKFDLIHTHTAKAGFLGRIAAAAAGAGPVIHTPHGHNFYGYFGKLLSAFIVYLEKFASFFTDKMLVFTELEKEDYLCRGIMRKDDIKVICSGIELDSIRACRGLRDEKRRQLGFEAGDKIIGMVSRLEEVKGPRYFIQAAARLAKKNNEVKFIIAGDGSLKTSLENIAASAGIADRIKFLGWRQDSLEVISCLDILAQPSLNEAVGRVILEAQALGVSVVASDTGGIPRVIENGVTGILVPPGDSVSLSGAFARLLDNEGEKNIMSENARKQVEKKYSSLQMSRDILNTYEEVMK